MAKKSTAFCLKDRRELVRSRFISFDRPEPDGFPFNYVIRLDLFSQMPNKDFVIIHGDFVQSIMCKESKMHPDFLVDLPPVDNRVGVMCLSSVLITVVGVVGILETFSMLASMQATRRREENSVALAHGVSPYAQAIFDQLSKT